MASAGCGWIGPDYFARTDDQADTLADLADERQPGQRKEVLQIGNVDAQKSGHRNRYQYRHNRVVNAGGLPRERTGLDLPPSTGPVSMLARLRQLGPLADDNLLIFRDRTPKGRHYTERSGGPSTGLQDSSFGAGCFGNVKSS